MRRPDEDRDQWWNVLRQTAAESDKRWSVAFCLSLFLGFLGVDRFYLGYGLLGILKLCTFAALGFWWLVDVIWLLLGKMKDSEGRILKRPFGK